MHLAESVEGGPQGVRVSLLWTKLSLLRLELGVVDDVKTVHFENYDISCRLFAILVLFVLVGDLYVHLACACATCIYVTASHLYDTRRTTA